MILEIDVTDWEKEAKASPVQIRTQDDIIAVMSETSMKPLQLARMAIVLREKKQADDDILPPNKISLQLGAAHAISHRTNRQRVAVKIKDKAHDIPRWTATVTKDEYGTRPEEGVFNSDAPVVGSPVTLVEYNDKAAQERAVHYLMTNILGHIRIRLAVIAAGKGDVRGVVNELKSQIDRIASEFM